MKAHQRSEAREPVGAPGAMSGLRPAAVFIGVFALLEVAGAFLYLSGSLWPVMTATASVTGFLANATGVPATVAQAEIFMDMRILEINSECTGIYLYAAYIALLLASRRSWSHRIVGILAGVSALIVVNLFRLLLVVHISDKLPRAMPFLHDYLFQVLLVVAVLAVWGYWLHWSDPIEA